MAITYTYLDLMNTVARLMPRVIEADAGAYVLNAAMYHIWKRYDWRETLKVLPPFHLIPGEQDHGSPAVVVPSDFLGLRQAYFTRLNSSPVFRFAITVLKDLTLTWNYGIPGQICYQPAKASFRLYPRVPMNLGCPEYCIQGEYKKRLTKVTGATMASTYLPFDDIYLFNMVEVLKWAGWAFSGDPRAEKQFILANAAIDEMAANEGMELGDVNIAPAEPLAVTSMTNAFTPFGIGGRLFGF